MAELGKPGRRYIVRVPCSKSAFKLLYIHSNTDGRARYSRSAFKLLSTIDWCGLAVVAALRAARAFHYRDKLFEHNLVSGRSTPVTNPERRHSCDNTGPTATYQALFHSCDDKLRTQTLSACVPFT